jgi:hypothetical protein
MSEEENVVFFEGEKHTESEMKSLIGKYQGAFNDPVIIQDLRQMARLDEPWGCALSHEEFSYRAGMQDVIKYIEAMSSTTKE